MSIYIHIPFCSDICSYCDFAKVFYNEVLVDDYLKSLEQEIKENYKGELIKTIYIGGGTPTSLSVKQLNKLFDIIKVFKIDEALEFSVECNVCDTSVDKLKLFKEKGVNRLSIGVQSFNEQSLKFLNRNHNKEEVITLIKLVKKIGFSNISVDLIYALPDQTLDDLNNDIKQFLKLDINHIACYSLIIEEHTKLYINNIKNIDEDLDYKMYEHITSTLKATSFKHYEISNYTKNGYESKHNLVYWNNEHYYGFGVGASGYINNVRYDNTKSVTNYIKGKYRLNEEFLNKEDEIENELMLGFRKIKGINKKDFYKKYEVNLSDLFNIKDLIKKRELIDDGKNLYINDKYLYVSNNILINFIK